MTLPSQDATTDQICLGFLAQIIYKKNAPNMIILKTRSDQGHSDPKNKMVCHTWTSLDAATHQIWNSYLKEYRSYAPDLMPNLETRSEVMVTVTGKWKGTICHSKMHSHIKFGIPTSNNKRDMFQIIL